MVDLNLSNKYRHSHRRVVAEGLVAVADMVSVDTVNAEGTGVVEVVGFAVEASAIEVGSEVVEGTVADATMGIGEDVGLVSAIKEALEMAMLMVMVPQAVAQVGTVVIHLVKDMVPLAVGITVVTSSAKHRVGMTTATPSDHGISCGWVRHVFLFPFFFSDSLLPPPSFEPLLLIIPFAGIAWGVCVSRTRKKK